MNRGFKLTFVVSIVLNVFFLGLLLGHLPTRMDRPSSVEQRIEAAASQLSEPARSRFRKNIEQTRRDLQPIRQQIQEVRNEVLRIFVTEPFDETAYDQQVSQMTALRVQLSGRMADSMKQTAKGLSLEERQVVAEAFRRPPAASR